ncbi:MAG: hypothetical protein V4436_02075 [Patescibacteria group bacterium]
MTNHFQVTFNEKQNDLLTQIMKESLSNNRSDFLARLVVEEFHRREDDPLRKKLKKIGYGIKYE